VAAGNFYVRYYPVEPAPVTGHSADTPQCMKSAKRTLTFGITAASRKAVQTGPCDLAESQKSDLSPGRELSPPGQDSSTGYFFVNPVTTRLLKIRHVVLIINDGREGLAFCSGAPWHDLPETCSPCKPAIIANIQR
jgi:hypothetical protein